MATLWRRTKGEMCDAMRDASCWLRLDTVWLALCYVLYPLASIVSTDEFRQWPPLAASRIRCCPGWCCKTLSTCHAQGVYVALCGIIDESHTFQLLLTDHTNLYVLDLCLSLVAWLSLCRLVPLSLPTLRTIFRLITEIIILRHYLLFLL